MATFRVYITQYHTYEIEAEDEWEAENLALKEFEADMRCPIADTHYDEIDVEEIEED